MEDHQKRAREWPPTLEPALQALEDAHETWHDAYEAYHDPARFRRAVEALVQTLRNVTWRLQSRKYEFKDFDSWYVPWQEYMRQDVRLSWLNEARVDVVKRSGLNSASFARISVIDSYSYSPPTVFEVPITTSTAEIVRQAQTQIPREIRPYATIEVARRWQAPNFPDQELLSVLAHCWHVLDALLIYGWEVHQGSEPKETPGDFVRTVEVPGCMLIPRDVLPILVEADTGNEVELGWEKAEYDKEKAQKATERYKLEPGPISNEALEAGQELHDQARTIFKKDGTHVPILYLRAPAGEWEPRVVLTEGKRHKFLLWRRVAHEVAYRGHDAYILTSEMWVAPMDELSRTPYFHAESHPRRREALVTSVEAADGGGKEWCSEIVRFMGKAFLKKPIQMEVHEGGFSMPIRRVWAARRKQSEAMSS